eukprot:1580966-Rhodomonas_salina.1
MFRREEEGEERGGGGGKREPERLQQPAQHRSAEVENSEADNPPLEKEVPRVGGSTQTLVPALRNYSIVLALFSRVFNLQPAVPSPVSSSFDNVCQPRRGEEGDQQPKFCPVHLEKNRVLRKSTA